MATQTPKFPPDTLPETARRPGPAAIAAAYPQNTNTPPGSGAPVVSAHEILMDLVSSAKSNDHFGSWRAGFINPGVTSGNTETAER